jgi:hypothetical protein
MKSRTTKIKLLKNLALGSFLLGNITGALTQIEAAGRMPWDMWIDDEQWDMWTEDEQWDAWTENEIPLEIQDSPRQMEALTREQIAALTDEQLQALTREQLEAMTDEQRQVLMRRQRQAMADEQGQDLADEQRQAMADEQGQDLADEQRQDSTDKQGTTLLQPNPLNPIRAVWARIKRFLGY